MSDFAFTGACLIGCGGTGSILAPLLLRLMQYHPRAGRSLVLIDGDSVEARNLERQAFSPGAIGANKAHALADQLDAQCDRQLATTAQCSYLDRAGVLAWMRQFSQPLLILAVDNDATIKASLEACDLFKGDFLWINPGNADASDGDGLVRGNVLWYGRTGGQTIGSDPREAFSNIRQPGDFIPRAGGCSEQAPSHPQLLPANALAAAWALTVIHAALENRLPASGSLFFDGLAMRASS